MLVAEGKRRICNEVEQAVAKVVAVVCVHDVEEARKRAAEKFPVAMIDIDLPGGGLSLADEMNSISPGTHILLYGENPTAETLERAINSRVAGFVRIPFERAHLREKVTGLLQSPPRSGTRTDNDMLLRARRAGLLALARLAEHRDTDTGMHVERVAALSEELTRRMRDEDVYADQINDAFLASISMAAALHDIGKVAIPDAILRKPGNLTPEEFELMKTHTVKGWEVIEAGRQAYADDDYEMDLAAMVIRHHHEKFDGTGYPDGLKGEAIPLAARIVAVIDAYDAMRTSRVYNPRRASDATAAEIRRCAGSHFDPKIAEVFLRHVDVIENMGKTIERITARWK